MLRVAPTAAWMPLLTAWVEAAGHDDLKMLHHARRAMLHLEYFADPDLHSPLYADGIFPVHESDRYVLTLASSPLQTDDSSALKSTLASQESLQRRLSTRPAMCANRADVVFVHGLQGGAFTSWYEDWADKATTCFWPGLWFPMDLQRRTGPGEWAAHLRRGPEVR